MYLSDYFYGLIHVLVLFMEFCLLLLLYLFASSLNIQIQTMWNIIRVSLPSLLHQKKKESPFVTTFVNEKYICQWEKNTQGVFRAI